MTRYSFLLSAALAASCAHAQNLVITHANVIDTVSGKIQRNASVSITGNRITAVSTSNQVATKATKTINAHGQYLIPGLWDMHTHVYFDSTERDGTDLVLPLFIANGITAVRDMGSDLDPVLKARSDIAAHRILGPRMVVSGPMLDGPKSHYRAAIGITTPADGRKLWTC